MAELQNIRILYEDNHLLVVVKPVNIPVCKDASGDLDLLSYLKNYLKIKYNKKGNVYLGLVHRLDRPVSGVMVFAKTSKAARRLSNQVRDHVFKKTYWAVCNGYVGDSDIFIDYLDKNKKLNVSYVTDSKHGKLAKLRYSLISCKNNLSLIKINLETGRSHQIRVQFASRGFPLVGDYKYNNMEKRRGCFIALFAKQIEFEHPTTKKWMVFEVDLPRQYPFNLFNKNRSIES